MLQYPLGTELLVAHRRVWRPDALARESCLLSDDNINNSNQNNEQMAKTDGSDDEQSEESSDTDHAARIAAASRAQAAQALADEAHALQAKLALSGNNQNNQNNKNNQNNNNNESQAEPIALRELAALGCFVANVVGDALGAPLEFMRVRYPPFADDDEVLKGFDDALWKRVTRVGGNKFALAPGQWTDDASMAQWCLLFLLFICVCVLFVC